MTGKWITTRMKRRFVALICGQKFNGLDVFVVAAASHFIANGGYIGALLIFLIGVPISVHGERWLSKHSGINPPSSQPDTD